MQASRWTSRKFLLSLSTQITSIVVLLWPSHESMIVQAGQSITALIVLGLSALGYVTAETTLDHRNKARRPNPAQS